MKLTSSHGIQIIPYRENVPPFGLGATKSAVFIPKNCLTFDSDKDKLATMMSDWWLLTLGKKKKFVREYAAFFVGRFCKDRELVPSTDKLINRIANNYVICKDINVFTSVLLEYSRELQNWKTHVLYEI